MKQQKTPSINQSAGMGLATGIGFGLIFGTMLGNAGMGIALGAAFGLMFGLGYDQQRKK